MSQEGKNVVICKNPKEDEGLQECMKEKASSLLDC